MGRQHGLDLRRGGRAGQGVEVQRHTDQHALREIADRGDEDRPPAEPGVRHDLRQVLVLEVQAVEEEGIRRPSLEFGDQSPCRRRYSQRRRGSSADGLAAAALPPPAAAAGRWRRWGSSRGWRLAGRRRSPPPGRSPFRESRRPRRDRCDARSRRPAAAAHRRRVPPPAPPLPFAASSGRQRTTRSTSAISARLAAGFLRSASGRESSRSPGWAAKRARICRPVVPASPSMNRVGIGPLGIGASSSLREVGRKAPGRQGAEAGWPPPLRHSSRAPASALAELEGPAGLPLAVFLALHHARIAGEEAGLLQDAAQFRIVVDKGRG